MFTRTFRSTHQKILGRNLFFCKAGVKHVILAVSYRAEQMEQELKEEAQKVIKL